MERQIYKTPEQIRQRGLLALNEALGPVDTARFIRLFDKGEGDYTAEKEQLVADIGIDEIVAGIEARNSLSAK